MWTEIMKGLRRDCQKKPLGVCLENLPGESATKDTASGFTSANVRLKSFQWKQSARIFHCRQQFESLEKFQFLFQRNCSVERSPLCFTSKYDFEKKIKKSSPGHSFEKLSTEATSSHENQPFFLNETLQFQASLLHNFIEAHSFFLF